MTAPGHPASPAAEGALAAFARGAVVWTTALSGLAAMVGLSACSASRPPIRTEERVDLSRFMGDWYVLASIPTMFEKDIHDAVESYSLEEDGSISTTFTFRDGSPDGEERSYHPRGFVVDPESNAVWGMQFVWPVRADYRIV